MYEAWSFSEPVAQPVATGDEEVLVDHVSQFSFPLTVAIPLGERWTLDVAGAYASGRVVLSAPDPELGTTEYQLSGVTDTRLRATGRLSSNISLSLGLNLPTGKTSFDAEELSAFRVLAAPPLSFQVARLGSGVGGVAGLVFSKQLGEAWA